MAKMINVGPPIHMFYVVNNLLNDLCVLSNKAVGPRKNQKLIKIWLQSILESRVCTKVLIGGKQVTHGFIKSKPQNNVFMINSIDSV